MHFIIVSASRLFKEHETTVQLPLYPSFAMPAALLNLVTASVFIVY